MSDYLLQGAIEIELNEETVSYQAKRKKTLCYEILHGERKVAEITTNGQALIYDEKFLPYDLYLEEGRDFEIQLNNIDNFIDFFCTIFAYFLIDLLILTETNAVKAHIINDIPINIGL